MEWRSDSSPFSRKTTSIFRALRTDGARDRDLRRPAAFADNPAKGRSRYAPTLFSGRSLSACWLSAQLACRRRLNSLSRSGCRSCSRTCPRIKFRPAASAEILRRYLELSGSVDIPVDGRPFNVTHLIWPESPFPFCPRREPQALSMIGPALAGRTTLLTSAIRLDGEDHRCPGAQRLARLSMEAAKWSPVATNRISSRSANISRRRACFAQWVWTVRGAAGRLRTR